ncbi:hypothetical protein Tco_1276965 [Tanacetum coccineum]
MPFLWLREFCSHLLFRFSVGTAPLLSKLTNKSRQKYVSYLRFVSCALEVLLGSNYTQDESFGSSPPILSNSNFSKDSSKVTPIELTAFMVAVNNHEKSANPLPFTIKQKKRKPHNPTEDSEKSHSVSSGYVPDPQDPERNKQLVGTVKTTSLLEGPRWDKDSEGLKPPTDMEPLTSGTNAKYQVNQTLSASLRYLSMTKNEGNTSFEVKPDSKTLQLKTFVDFQALLLSDDEMIQEIDNEEVITEDQWAHHEEAIFSYNDLRAYIDGYYEENVDHRDQIDKLVQESVKDDLALNRKVIESTEAYTKNSTSYYYQSGSTLSRMGQVINFHVGHRLTAIESSQSEIRSKISSLKLNTLEIKSMMIEIFQAFKGENVTQADIEEPPSYTKGENDDMQTEEDKVRKE